MKLGTRLNEALARALMIPEGGTVQFDKDSISLGSGGHGTHGERGRRPSGTARPLVIQWAERFERMIEALERDVEQELHGGCKPATLARGPKPAEGLRHRIREYEGRDPVWVAFVEGCSVELVRKVRNEANLHRISGAPLERSERPLTARPRDTLDARGEL